MPDKLNDWTGGPAPFGYSWKAAKDEEGHVVQHLEMGPFAKKIGQTYKEIVLILAKLGHYIIIDDVTFGKKGVDKWREPLKDYSVIFVGVHAPLEVIEERERRRGDRMIGSARGQYKITHQDVTYDLDIDSHNQSVQENVQKIIGKVA